MENVNYKGYIIKANQVPEKQRNHGFGFGLAFEAINSETNVPVLGVVIKSMGDDTEGNIALVSELGMKKIYSL